MHRDFERQDGSRPARRPRETRRRSKAIEAAIHRAKQRFGREPSEEEIAAVYREADEIAAASKAAKAQVGPSNPGDDARWAELEIRAPIDAIILEKNFNVGAFIDNNDPLFIIADTSVLQVSANVYEEQLPLIGSLPDEQRLWKIEVKSDPLAKPRIDRFGLIGRIVDPQQHTAKVVGWLDNHDNQLAAGQFITATIEIPAEPGMIAIPTPSVLEEGDLSSVLVQSPDNDSEFSLRRVFVTRRQRDLMYVKAKSSADGTTTGLEVGEKVVVSGVLTLAAELRIHKPPTPK